MDFLYLFGSIFAESAAKTIDKLNYHRNRITPRVMMFVVFLVMTISITAYILAMRQALPHISLRVAVLLLGVGAFSFGGNVFDELSLKSNDLSLREPLVDFEPILAGLVGYAVYPHQRKTAFLVAFILGAFIVRWGIHRRKLRKGQKKGMTYLLIGTILYAVLPSLYQETLHYISPSYLAFFRVSAILVLTTVFFPPKRWKGFTTKRVNYVIAAGIIYAIGAIVSLYAIQIYGVVLTMLFLMLGPALRYIAGQFILHERVRKGEILSSLMLSLVVALAAFVR